MCNTATSLQKKWWRFPVETPIHAYRNRVLFIQNLNANQPVDIYLAQERSSVFLNINTPIFLTPPQVKQNKITEKKVRVTGRFWIFFSILNFWIFEFSFQNTSFSKQYIPKQACLFGQHLRWWIAINSRYVQQQSSSSSSNRFIEHDVSTRKLGPSSKRCVP